MSASYPNNLYDYYGKNPDSFEEIVDKKKKIINYVLAAICILLLIFPSIIPLGSLLVRIAAGIGLLYFGFSAYFGGEDWYNKQSGGKITELAVKKFDVPGISEGQKITQMFENNDWAGLANEPESNDRPLQLYIHEDAKGKAFYLQLRCYFSSSDFRGVSDVKTIKEPEYSQVYQIIKSIKSTK